MPSLIDYRCMGQEKIFSSTILELNRSTSFIEEQRAGLRREGRIIEGLIASLFLVLWVSVTLAHIVETDDRRVELDDQAHLVSAAIQKRMQGYADVLIAFRALFQASDEVNEEGFNTFFESLSIPQHYPGLVGVRFVKAVESSHAPAHVITMESIDPARGSDAHSRGSEEPRRHFLVDFAAPQTDAKFLRGFDVLSDPVRAAAYERAAATGEFSISETMILVADQRQGMNNGGPESRAYVLVAPLLREGSLQAGPEHSRHRTDRFISAVFRKGDLLEGLPVTTQNWGPLQVSIEQHSAPKQPSLPIMDTLLRPRTYAVDDYFDFAGRHWRVRISAGTPGSLGGPMGPYTLVTSIVALIFFVVVGCLLVRSYATRKRLLEQVARASRGIVRANKLMEQILDHVPVPLFIKDGRTHKCFLWNRAIEALTGIPRQKILHAAGFRMHEAEDRMPGTGSEGQSVHVATPMTSEEAFTTPWGEKKLFLTTTVPISEEGSQRSYLLGIIEDISERQRKAEEEALSKKLQAIGTLSAGIAHELNTPLQYVLFNLQYLLKNTPDCMASARSASAASKPKKAWDAIHQSLQGVEQAISIVRAMRDFGSGNAGQLECCDIRNVIQSSLVISRFQWKHHAEVELSFEPENFEFYCHRSELIQALTNLIVNAAHAIEDRKLREKGLIVIRAKLQGDEVVIEVEDNGVGISPEHQPRIFDPFFTTKDTGRGMGQGLPISRAIIVQKHKGSLRFESLVGKGTTFIITLPVGRALQHESEMHIC